MSTREDLEVELLDACQLGKLQSVRELIEKKTVDPSKVVERRNRDFPNYADSLGSAKSCTPLHYACL